MFFLPLAIAAALVILFAVALRMPQQDVPQSALIGRAAPALPQDVLAGQMPQSLSDKRTLVNFFASWCAPCKAEHGLLQQTAKDYPDLQIIGVAYRDSAENIANYLATLGNPYSAVAIGGFREIADWGLTGVPESFLVDGDGIVRRHWAGVLDAQSIQQALRVADATEE